MVIVVEIVMVTRVPNLDEAASISHNANTLGKDMKAMVE